MGDVTTVLWPNRVNKNALQKAFPDAKGLVGGVVTVSAKGTALAAQAPNDGAMYGPDTPGTTTCGIQEAINALTQRTAVDSVSGGGKVVLGPGEYVCTSQITLPTTFAFELVLEGAGMVRTLVINNIGAATDLFVDTAPNGAISPNRTLNLVVRNMGFADQQDTRKRVLWHLKYVNQALFEKCLFTTYQCLGLSTAGANLVYIAGVPANKVGTVGIYRETGGSDNLFVVRDCAFYGLACGAFFNTDHARVTDSVFANIGKYFSGGTQTGTQYTAAAGQNVNNAFAAGCGLVFSNTPYDAAARDVQFFYCNVCVLHLADAGSSPQLYYRPALIETSTYAYVADNTDTANVLIDVASTSTFGGIYGKIDIAAGTITVATPPGMVLFSVNNPLNAGSIWQVVCGTVTALDLDYLGNLTMAGNWVGAYALKYARVTTSDATTTGQSLVDVTGLSVALAASATYEFEAALSVATSAVTTGTKYGVQFSAAGAAVEGQVIGSLTTSAAQSERVSALNTGGLAYLTTSGQSGQVLIKGILTTGVNAGNLTIQHLKVTSGTSTVKVNSFLKVKRIA